MMAKAANFEDFLNEALAKEIAELHADRAAINTDITKAVTKALRELALEIQRGG
jgi:hypothetical protein